MLVLVVVAISTAYALSKTALIEVMSTRQYLQHARATLLARSGVALAVRTLQDDLLEGDETTRAVESDLDAWALLSRQEIALPGDALLRVKVTDVGGKLNLNALIDRDGSRVGEASKSFLKAALQHIAETAPAFKGSSSYGDEDVDDLADALLDWLDKDDETRVGTPEEEFYVGIKKAEGRAAQPPGLLARRARQRSRPGRLDARSAQSLLYDLPDVPAGRRRRGEPEHRETARARHDLSRPGRGVRAPRLARRVRAPEGARARAACSVRPTRRSRA